MPFRDPAWEEFQRDCDIFPAYTDYLYGPDTRLQVTQEPGLHPQIYPVHQWQAYSAPIRYTNGMPSRTWSYQTADSIEQPGNAVVRRQPNGPEVLRGQGLSRKSSRRSTAGVDVRLQMGSPAPQLLPPHGVRTAPKEEMARRKMMNAPQQRPASTNSPQQPVRMTRLQAQARNAPTPSSNTAAQPSQSFFHRSSSTTSVDDHVAQMVSARKNGMLSPTASPSPIPAPPAHDPSQNGLILPPNPFQFSTPVAPSAAPPTPHNPTGQIPILRPSDLVDNPRYSCIEVNKREFIHRLLLERWNMAQKAPDHATRAKIIAEIQHISFSVHKSLPSMEAVAQMQKQRQVQLAQQPQYHALQPSPCQQPQLPHCSPLLQAPRQPHDTLHLNPQPPQPQPQLSELHAYQHQPQQMHQHQQQNQPQSYYPRPPQAQHQQPQTAPQILHSPSSSISRTQASASKAVSPAAFAQLRANMDAHLPQVWQCLQLGDQQYQPTDPKLVQQKQQARAWLDSFKRSLPAEAHAYMQYVVDRMWGAVQHGRDPLAAVGIEPLE